MVGVAMERVKKEYACETTTEKMLAEQIGFAQIKLFAYSDALDVWLNAAGRSKSPIKGREIDALSRHIDRTQRQMLAAITVLRQIKYPHLQVNVIARNAFVAQNQQINEGQTKA